MKSFLTRAWLAGSAAALLLVGDALAKQQPKPKADNPQPKPPAAAPQKPESSPAPKDRAPEKKTDQPEKKADQPAEKKADQPKPERPEKPAEKKSDSPTEKKSDTATDKKSDTDTAEKKSETPADKKSDTAGKKQDKEVKPSDLGFSFAEESDKGLKVSKLAARSIGSKADFKQGDIIISVNDRRIRSERDFIRWIHADRSNRITVIVLRDDREVTVYLDPAIVFETVTVQGVAWLGVDLNDRFATAAVVRKVHSESPAHKAGLRDDDVILAIDGQRINSPDHLGQVIARMEPGQEVEIRIERNKQADVVDATLGQRESVSSRTEVLPRR